MAVNFLKKWLHNVKYEKREYLSYCTHHCTIAMTTCVMRLLSIFLMNSACKGAAFVGEKEFVGW